MLASHITIGRSERMLLAAIFFVGVLPVSSLSSQVAPDAPVELRVRLHTSGGMPVAGALVALLDAKDNVIAEGLSTESGTRVLRAPPGEYRVRARRIGFLPFTSSPVVLPRQDELLVVVETPRVVLDRIVVNAKSPCKRSDPGPQSLGIVWGEIVKALRASQLTTEDLAGFGRARTYWKEVGTDGTVLSSDTTLRAITDRRPFSAKDPAALAAEGYVLGDERNGWNYFAPDETVLLSEQFAATHCFRLVREAARRGQIGVAFEPVPRRKVADIVGVIWVDEHTAELREVVFEFVNAGVLSRFDAGGFTRFLRVKSGAWIVDEWRLRVPLLAMRLSPHNQPLYSVIGYSENGGGFLGGGRRTQGVIDSLKRKP
jgi:hypothetical protein